MLFSPLVKKIQAFLSTQPPDKSFPAQAIADAIGEPGLKTHAALIYMAHHGLVKSCGKFPRYMRSEDFIWRHITPVSPGAPEYVVETHDGRLLCWCQSEADARTITAALKGA